MGPCDGHDALSAASDQVPKRIGATDDRQA
jgi:hypothetical protein